MKYKFAFFDGDNVGSTIEILLLENKILEAKNLSENINKAINEIKQFLEDKGEVLIAGGDDILIKLNNDDDNFIEIFDSIGKIFFELTGLTISGGVGDDIKTAIYELSIAKLYGKNQIKFA